MGGVVEIETFWICCKCTPVGNTGVCVWGGGGGGGGHYSSCINSVFSREI